MSFKKFLNAKFFAGMAALILALVMAGGTLSAKPAPKDKDSDKAFLGVYLQDLDRDTQEALELDSRQGALVEDVTEDGPAQKAGLKAEDVIIVFDGKKVSDSGDLREYIANRKAGQEVEIVVVRDGQKKEFNVKLEKGEPRWTDVHRIEKMIPGVGDSRTFSFSMPGFNRPRMGVQITDLSEQLGEYFGVTDGQGALITQVVEESPAQKAGLKAGDVIVKIDTDDVENTSDVYEALEDFEGGEKVAVDVLRKGQKKSFAVELSEPERAHAEAWTPRAGDDDNLRIFRNSDSGDQELKAEMERLQEELQALKDELRQLREDKR
ncbi:MAG: PDZ domain-containing protein [candidate division Zixibacteria bacterium]|nr:PDZ domain-containing protein [candidate division Zixibacteria bacterium]